MIPEFNGNFTQWLHGFWLCAHTGNMTVAGGLAKRTQSAISHQIKALEEEYGVKLFERRKGQELELTRSSKFLLEKTAKIFEIINSIEETIGVLPAKLKGQVHLATTYTVVQFYLPELLALFKQYYPNVDFRIHGDATLEKIVELVHNGKVDMAIVCAEDLTDEFRMTLLFSTQVALVSPKTGPYAMPDLPALERLAHIPYIAAPHNSSMEIFVTKHLGRRSIFMKNAHMVSYHDAAKIYAKLGLGVTFLDEFACTEKDKEELNVVPMSAYLPKREYMAVSLSCKSPSPAQEVFIRFLARGKRFKGGPFDGPGMAYEAEDADGSEDAAGVDAITDAAD